MGAGVVKLNERRGQLERGIRRYRDGAWADCADAVAVEEPLEMRVEAEGDGGREVSPVSITMRTPGADFELAAGFLFGEGILAGRADIAGIEYDRELVSEAGEENTVVVRLRGGMRVDLEGQRRNFAVTSACGVCGKASLASLAMDGCEPIRSEVRMSAAVLMSLPSVLRERQRGFESTGGVHAAGLFTAEGELLAVGEDVGRHNAFDKLVGGQLLGGTIERMGGSVALLSGRASYELLQKALRARVPVVAAVGAPSSLAMEIAQNFGITLVGFLKQGSFNVYSGGERICD